MKISWFANVIIAVIVTAILSLIYRGMDPNGPVGGVTVAIAAVSFAVSCRMDISSGRQSR